MPAPRKLSGGERCTRTVGVRLPELAVEALRLTAAARGRTPADVAREILLAGLGLDAAGRCPPPEVHSGPAERPVRKRRRSEVVIPEERPAPALPRSARPDPKALGRVVLVVGGRPVHSCPDGVARFADGTPYRR
jgi:hypothetical protein